MFKLGKRHRIDGEQDDRDQKQPYADKYSGQNATNRRITKRTSDQFVLALIVIRVRDDVFQKQRWRVVDNGEYIYARYDHFNRHTLKQRTIRNHHQTLRGQEQLQKYVVYCHAAGQIVGHNEHIYLKGKLGLAIIARRTTVEHQIEA